MKSDKQELLNLIEQSFLNFDESIDGFAQYFTKNGSKMIIIDKEFLADFLIDNGIIVTDNKPIRCEICESYHPKSSWCAKKGKFVSKDYFCRDGKKKELTRL